MSDYLWKYNKRDVTFYDKPLLKQAKIRTSIFFTVASQLCSAFYILFQIFRYRDTSLYDKHLNISAVLCKTFYALVKKFPLVFEKEKTNYGRTFF